MDAKIRLITEIQQKKEATPTKEAASKEFNDVHNNNLYNL